MQLGRVLIHSRCSLGAAVAFRAVEVQGINGVLAVSALEDDPAVHSIGGIAAHIVIVIPRRS